MQKSWTSNLSLYNCHAIVVGGKEHVESLFETGHIVATPVPFVDVILLVVSGGLLCSLSLNSDHEPRELKRDSSVTGGQGWTGLVGRVAGGPPAAFADEDEDQRDEEVGEGAQRKYEYGATLTGRATSIKTRPPPFPSPITFQNSCVTPIKNTIGDGGSTAL